MDVVKLCARAAATGVTVEFDAKATGSATSRTFEGCLGWGLLRIFFPGSFLLPGGCSPLLSWIVDLAGRGAPFLSFYKGCSEFCETEAACLKVAPLNIFYPISIWIQN